MVLKVIIIGGGAAGPKAAAKLRRENPDAIIDLYTEESVVSYSACGLPYFIEGIIPHIEELLVRSPETFKKHGINIHLKTRCYSINRESQSVTLKDLAEDKEFIEYYDILILATGARPYIPPIENNNGMSNVFTLRTLSDGINIRNEMLKSKTVTLIGFGFIGIELCEAFIKNGLSVNIIDINKYIMGMFDEDISLLIQSYIQSSAGGRIKIYNGEQAVRFEGENGRVNKVITREGQETDTDFVVICAGIVPNSELAKEAGLKLGVKNSIWVNTHLKTSAPLIYAVGDCAEKTHIVTNKPCWLPLGSTANKEGRCAALNIANANCDFEGVLGAAVSRYFNFTTAMTGITEREAKAAGIEVITATVTKEDRAGYMPEAGEITLKLTADKNTREILGAQGIGIGDAEKRIATVSAAILDAVKTDDLLNIDLPYSPAYSTAIDPLINALQIIAEKSEYGR